MMNEVIEEIATDLETALASRTPKVTVYRGNIGLAARSNLPAIIIMRRATTMERVNSAQDRYRHSVSILVVTSMIQEFSNVENSKVIEAEKTLSELIEGKDSNTNQVAADTVLGCLLKKSNMNGDSWCYNIDPKVNYEVASPKEFFYTAGEIQLDFITTFSTRRD